MATNVKATEAKATTAKTAAKKTTASTAAKTTAAKKTPVKAAASKPAAAKTTTVKATEVKKAAAKPAAKTTEVKKVAVKAPKVKAVTQDATRNRRKVLRGVVISNKMDKTGVVEITRKVPHPLYKKVVTKTSRFKFHDENNECAIGDTIEVMETRPLSKDKYFRLVRIVERVK